MNLGGGLLLSWNVVSHVLVLTKGFDWFADSLQDAGGVSFSGGNLSLYGLNEAELLGAEGKGGDLSYGAVGVAHLVVMAP